MGIGLVLEADNRVIGVSHDDHVAGCFPLSPAIGPQVEGVAQVDVGEERRDYRPLPGSLVADLHRPIFEHTRSQPFLDQADDARVADTVLHEPDQPFLADRVEACPRA